MVVVVVLAVVIFIIIHKMRTHKNKNKEKYMVIRKCIIIIYLFNYFINQQSSEGTITAPWDMELVKYTQLPLQA